MYVDYCRFTGQKSFPYASMKTDCSSLLYSKSFYPINPIFQLYLIFIDYQSTNLLFHVIHLARYSTNLHFCLLITFMIFLVLVCCPIHVDVYHLESSLALLFLLNFVHFLSLFLRHFVNFYISHLYILSVIIHIS